MGWGDLNILHPNYLPLFSLHWYLMKNNPLLSLVHIYTDTVKQVRLARHETMGWGGFKYLTPQLSAIVSLHW